MKWAEKDGRLWIGKERDGMDFRDRKAYAPI